MLSEKMNHCPRCGKVISHRCPDCHLPFSAEFSVGFRDELIGALVEEYKFFGVKKLGGVLAEILNEFLPDFSGEVIVVPLPTIRKHIRERGLDHTLVVAKKLAKKRGWKAEQVIGRKKNTVQLGATEKKRREQAKEAFLLSGEIRKEATYLVFDDVWTTGASMTEVGKMLEKAGAKKIVAVVFATNRRGKKPEIRR